LKRLKIAILERTVVNSTDFAKKLLNFAKISIYKENVFLKKNCCTQLVCGPQKNIYESWGQAGTYDIIIITRHKYHCNPNST
jgi:hypothetical protein